MSVTDRQTVVARVKVDPDGTCHYGQDYARCLQSFAEEGTADIVRKKSRAIVVQLDHEFTVETDRGLMVGHAGDYLVTNHPDDDPGSDIWTISKERFDQTYEPA